MTNVDRFLHGYHDAYERIVDAGYMDEILWAEDLAKVKPYDLYVCREYAHVVCCSGFRVAVVQKMWPKLRIAFHEFVPRLIDESCLPSARAVLHHEGKLQAIVATAAEITREGIDRILEDAKDPPRLMRLPWIGTTTCYHLAKNLGVDCVKPDVHLVRAAKATDYYLSPLELCRAIAEFTGDRLAMIDQVLWRYGEQQKAHGWPDWEELWNLPAM